MPAGDYLHVSCSSSKESRSVMRRSMESVRPMRDRQGLLLKDPFIRALSTSGLTGAGHNILYQLQRGDKLDLFCCELEMAESCRKHTTSSSKHCRPAHPSKQCLLFAPVYSKTHQSPWMRSACATDRYELSLPGADANSTADHLLGGDLMLHHPGSTVGTCIS